MELLGQHLLDEVLAKAIAADEQGEGKEHVDDGHLPLDEGIVVEEDGEAAEETDQHEGEQLHLLDPAIAKPAVQELQAGDDHQGASGGVDVVKLVDREEDDQGDELDKLLHAGL